MPEHSIQVIGHNVDGMDRVLTPEALGFVADLHRKFNSRRLTLLNLRSQRQDELDRGIMPSFPTSRGIRDMQWQTASCPADLMDRRVEITGPVERKMMINALNSGARVFMADFEDSCAPAWENIIAGQVNLQDAVRRTISFQADGGKVYSLNERVATLKVRPRGWHLKESHVLVDGHPMSAGLFDFGLYLFHNARELSARGSGPYFYLPKLEGYGEARLWSDVFAAAEDKLRLRRGTIKVTVLIETVMAAFQMEEILYDLRSYIVGLNAGRWDYLFSLIKRMKRHDRFVLPDRSAVTMEVPFMAAYCRLLVETCHKRGAHAIGGMSAFIPNRKDQEVTRLAIEKVRQDKQREASLGFDGTWVAHPDLVAVAERVFNERLGAGPHQKLVLRTGSRGPVGEAELLDMDLPERRITADGVRVNVRVALQYIESWLRGVGAVAINNLMEDAATAEICRAQLWQWIYHKSRMDTGKEITAALFRRVLAEECESLKKHGEGRFDDAAAILSGLVTARAFTEFLTIPAYDLLTQRSSTG